MKFICCVKYIVVSSIYFLCVTYSEVQAREHMLSFVIPAYNCAGRVERAIESIYKQHLSVPFEVVCTDDGSKDTTWQVLQHYAQLYNNFHAYRHDVNKGAYETRNTCVKNAQGDLIFNLDADNYLDENPDCSVQKLIDLIDQTGCEVASFAEVKTFSSDQKYIETWVYAKDEHNFTGLRHLVGHGLTPPCSGNYLYTKKCFERVGGFHEPAHDNWCFGFRLMATGTKMAILPSSWYWHEVDRSDSMHLLDERAGKNIKGMVGVMLKYPEVFPVKVNAYLAQCEQKLSKRAGGQARLKQEIKKKSQSFQKKANKISQHKLSPKLPVKLSVTIDLDKYCSFLPQVALDALFAGYRAEEQGLFVDAHRWYKKAIQLGCYHPHLHERIAVVAAHLRSNGIVRLSQQSTLAEWYNRRS